MMHVGLKKVDDLMEEKENRKRKYLDVPNIFNLRLYRRFIKEIPINAHFILTYSQPYSLKTDIRP